jgi:hypothetical protein
MYIDNPNADNQLNTVKHSQHAHLFLETANGQCSGNISIFASGASLKMSASIVQYVE